MATPQQELSEFFRFLWRDTNAAVCISSRDSTDIWKNMMFSWPTAEPVIIDYVLAEAAKGNDVYQSCAMYKTTKSRHSDNWLGSWVLWAEFDGNGPEEWDEGTQGVSAPSLRLQSSMAGHQHCYWSLDEFITDASALESKNRSIAYGVHADTSCWNRTRILRPPGTINFGYTHPERKDTHEVRIIETTESRYQSDFIQSADDFRPVVATALEQAELPSVASALAQGKWSDKFLELFEGESPPKGKRSDGLMAAGYFAAEAGLDDAGIYTIVRAVDDRWEVYTKRSDRQRRLIDIVERARRKHPEDDTPNFSKLFNGGADGTKAEEKTVFSYQEFMDAEVNIEWFYQDLISLGGYGIIAGDPGVGKTQIGLRLARSVACGDNFLGWKNERAASKVLFLSLEMNHPGLKLFLEQMDSTATEHELALFRQNLYLAPLASTIPLDKPEGRSLFQSFLEQYRPSVVFIDSLSKSTYKALTDEDAVKEFNQYMQAIRATYGVSVVIIHHTKKPQAGADRRDGLNSMYGNRFLSAEVDFLLSLYKTKEKGYIELEVSKLRYGAEPPNMTLLRHEDLSFSVDAIDVEAGEFSGNGGLFNSYKTRLDSERG